MSPAGGVERHLDRAELRDPLVEGAAVVVEGALSQPLLTEPHQVDVGDRPARTVGEPLGLVEQLAHLEHHRLPVPREVGARLAEPRRGVHVGREATLGCRLHEEPAVLGAADRDGAAGEVDQHGGAGERRLRARRHRHPHVLADLDVHDQPWHRRRREQQVGTERDLLATEHDRLAALVVAGREVPSFVELAVGRQVGLRGHAEHPAAVHDDRAVEHPQSLAQRRTDDEHHAEVAPTRRRRRRSRPRPRRAGSPAATGPRWRSRSASARGTPPPRRPRSAQARASTSTACALARGSAIEVGHRAGRDSCESLVVRRMEVHAPSLPVRE